jgi:hypothetical protein
MRAGCAFLVLSVAVAAAAAVSAPTAGELNTEHPVALFGPASAELRGAALWFAPPDGRVAASPALAIAAPALSLDTYEYEQLLRVEAAGRPGYEAGPLREEQATAAFSAAHVQWLGGGAEAVVRVLPAATAPVAVQVHDAHTVYANAATADDAAAPTTIRLGGDPAITPFKTLPSDARLIVGRAGEITIAGPAAVLFHDIAIAVHHAGGSDVYDGSVSETRVGSGAALAVRAWTDVILHVPAGSDIHIDWPHAVALAGRGLDLAAANGAEMRDASGTIRLDDDARVLQSEDVRMQGPLTATVGASSNGAGMVWRFFDPQPDAPLAAAPLPAEATAAGWVAGAASFLAASAAAGLFLHVRRRRARGQGPAPPAGDRLGAAAPGPAAQAGTRAGADDRETGLRLFQAGDVAAALEPLKRAAKQAPDAEVRYCLGVALLRAGRFGDGLGHVRAAVRGDAGYLHLLVTQPQTEAIRFERRFVEFMRKEARLFHDGLQMGYC